MPFINLDHLLATNIIEEDEPKLLKNLLYDGKINPREFELLKVLSTVNKTLNMDNELTQQSKSQLRNLCEKYFTEEAERSYNRLINFAKTKENVSWVLFSRTCQFIPWEEKNPLEGYIPRQNPIKKVNIIETLQFSEPEG
ncbi:MAG: hypothetical protein ACW981_03020 [Candidatus Hodarchaeales archaeon]|jgi:hypothetical protein